MTYERGSVNHTLQLPLGCFHSTTGSGGSANLQPGVVDHLADQTLGYSGQLAEKILGYTGQLVERILGFAGHLAQKALGLRLRLLRGSLGYVSFLFRWREGLAR